MARHADRLQILICIGAAFGLWNDVIDSARGSDTANLETGLTQSVVTLENSNAGLIPLATIAALVTAASPLISELPELAIGLVS